MDVGPIGSIFTVGINSESFPWPVHWLHTRNLPKFSATSDESRQHGR